MSKIIKSARRRPGALVSMLSTILVACGGGSDGTGSPTVTGIDPTVTGIDETNSPGVAVFGTISGFGSIIVNGVRFDTSRAAFTVDGQPGVQSDLSVGDVVFVQGTIAGDGVNGSADSVSFDDNVEGPISSINPVAGTLVVLGQFVSTTAATSFDEAIRPASLEGLAVNDRVEISGFVDAAGIIDATRIDLERAGGELEVTGAISLANSGNSQFSINSLVVDFSSAMLLGFPGGGISDGDLVEVKGATLGLAGEFIATQVEFRGDDFHAEQGTRLEIAGPITRFVSATDFDVSGFPIVTDDQTVFEGGVPTAIALDVNVEAEGTFNARGVLAAVKLSVREAGAVHVTGLIDSVGPGGSFAALGITIDVNSLTRVEDKSAQALEPFSADRLATGDYVDIRGNEFPAGSGILLAGRLERTNPDEKTLLEGFVSSSSQPTITILGVTVETSGTTVFRDVEGAVLSATEFFSTLAEGHLIRVDGTEVADRVLMADRLTETLPVRPFVAQSQPVVVAAREFPGQDWDGDGVADLLDNCVYVSNPDQEQQIPLDVSFTIGSACYGSYPNDYQAMFCAVTELPIPGRQELELYVVCVVAPDDPTLLPDDDQDLDGVPNLADNCVFLPNPGQENGNSTLPGDACDGNHDDILPYGPACTHIADQSSRLYTFSRVVCRGFISIGEVGDETDET